MKKINIFSKLAVLFTVLLYLVCWIMDLDIYEVSFMNSWASDVRFLHLTIFGLSLMIFGVGSVIFGILALVKIYKNQGYERWIISALTLWNILSLIYVLTVWGSFPYRI